LPNIFMLIQIVLEAYFQVEVISNVGEFDSKLGRKITNIGRGLALSMLVAHYMYLLGGLCNLLSAMFDKKREGWQNC